MEKIKVYPMVVGPISVNCYIISKGERAVIVDPGDEGARIASYIENHGLKPEAILMTHGHFDHFYALEEIQKKYDIPVYSHAAEKEYFEHAEVNGSVSFGRTPVEIKDFAAFKWLDDGEVVRVLDEDVKVLHVPGHSLGSLAFYFEQSDVVITGDALFNGSIGRTDIIHGNFNQLKEAVGSKLLTLPEQTVCYPGHGPATTVGDEVRTNPFFN